MDKTLIIICLIFLSITKQVSFSQEWVSIIGADYNPPFGFIYIGGGWQPGNKQFKIDPYTNKIWFAYDNIAHGLDEQGNYFKFDYTNTPAFIENTSFSIIQDFEFTQSYTFIVDRYNGVLNYDGSNWNQLASGYDWCSISSDNDTIWVSRAGSYYLIWEAGVVSSGALSGLERISRKKGEMWGVTSLGASSLYRIENNIPIYYQSDTCILLDNKNYDFKFSPYTDTFYTAGDLGISLAYNGIFFDSITPDNSSNMPTGPIREFEFDQYDNIWALFGTDAWTHSNIAYYEQATKTWTQVYDENNSPVKLDHRVSIEVDSAGNLYVADIFDLHVLKINNWPTWLDVLEHETLNFTAYPNPGTGLLHIQRPDEIVVDEVIVVDLSGKLLLQYVFKPELNVSQLQAGTYLLQLYANGNRVGTLRYVKE